MVNSVHHHHRAALSRTTFHFSTFLCRGAVDLLPVWFLLALTGLFCALMGFLPWSLNTLHIVFIAVAAAIGIVFAIIHFLLSRWSADATRSRVSASRGAHYHIPDDSAAARFYSSPPLRKRQVCGLPRLSSLRHALPVVELTVLGLLVLFSPRVMPSGFGDDRVIVPDTEGTFDIPAIVAWKVFALHLWFLFAIDIPLLADVCVGVAHYVVLLAQYQSVGMVTFIVAAQWLVVPLLCLIALFGYRFCVCASKSRNGDDGDSCTFHSDVITDIDAKDRRLGTHWASATKFTSALSMYSPRHGDAEDIPSIILSDAGTVIADLSPSFATLTGISPQDVHGRPLASLLDELCVEHADEFLHAIDAIACGDPERLERSGEHDKSLSGCEADEALSPLRARPAAPPDEDAGEYSTLNDRRLSPARMGGLARRLLLRGRAPPPPPAPPGRGGPRAGPFCVTLDAWARGDGRVVLRQPRLHAALDRLRIPALLLHPRSGRVLHWSSAAARATGRSASDMAGWPARLGAKGGEARGKGGALEAWLHCPGNAAPREVTLEPLAGEFVEEESAALEHRIECFTWPPRHFLWSKRGKKNDELPPHPGQCGSRTESCSLSSSEDLVEMRENSHWTCGHGKVLRELPLSENCHPRLANSPDAACMEDNRRAQWYFAPIANGRGDVYAWATAGVPLLCLLHEDIFPIEQLTDHSGHLSQRIQQKQEGCLTNAPTTVARECHAVLCEVLKHGDSTHQSNGITECAERAVAALECFLQECLENRMHLSRDESGVQTNLPFKPQLAPSPQSPTTSPCGRSQPCLLANTGEERNPTEMREEKENHLADEVHEEEDKDDDGDDDHEDSSGEDGAKDHKQCAQGDVAVEFSEAREQSKSPISARFQGDGPLHSEQSFCGRVENAGPIKGDLYGGPPSPSQKTAAPRLISPLPVEKFVTGENASTAAAGFEVNGEKNFICHSPKHFAQSSSGMETPVLVHSLNEGGCTSSLMKKSAVASSNNNDDKNKNLNSVDDRNDDEEVVWAMLRSSDEATIASCYICVRPGEAFFFGRSSKCHATTSDALVSSIQFAIVAHQQNQPYHQQHALTSKNMSTISTPHRSQQNVPFDTWAITLRDHSANGTFVNVKKVGKGKTCALHDHDLVTFRLSTSRFFLGFHFILLDQCGVPRQQTTSPTLSRLGSGPVTRRGTPHAYHHNLPQQQQHGKYMSSSLETKSPVGGVHASGTSAFKNKNSSGQRPGTTRSRSSRVGTSGSHHRETIEWKIGEEMLGKGGNAEVYLGINLTNGTLIAVKRVLLPTCEEGESNRAVLQQYRSLQEEINVLSKAVHPNIVQYYGSSQNQTYFNILLEFVPGGSLRHILDNFGGLSPGVIFLYLRQTLEGLRYLHQHNIVHSDVKAANILVTDKGRVKLSDFGTAKLLSHRQHSQSVDRTGKSGTLSVRTSSAGGDLTAGTHCSHRVTGTLCWMAPELIRDDAAGGPTKASDMWSVGCALIEMLSSNAPWWEYEFESEEQIINLLRYATEPPEIPECGECPELRDIAARCLLFDPAARPSCEALLQMVIDAAEGFQARQSPAASTMREGSVAAPLAGTAAEAGPAQTQ